MKSINILAELDFAGVYRIIGRSFLDRVSEVCYYVGQAGSGKWAKKGSQGMKGRLGRHLKNDGGELFRIVKDIELLTRIDYWLIDLDSNSVLRKKILQIASASNQEGADIFRLLLDHLEFQIKNQSEPIWHEELLNRARKKPKEAIMSELEELLKDIFENKMSSIHFPPLTAAEIEFRQAFRIVNSQEVRDIFNLRCYQDLEFAMDLLVEKWQIIKQELPKTAIDSQHSSLRLDNQANLFWMKFFSNDL
jgi:hypothetical protein